MKDPTPKFCRECGRMIVFVQGPSGVMPCNSFKVKVVSELYGRMFYLGDEKIMRGREAKPGESGVMAWESHYSICPDSRRRYEARQGKKKSQVEIANARYAAAKELERVKSALLERRTKEWANNGF